MRALPALSALLLAAAHGAAPDLVVQEVPGRRDALARLAQRLEAVPPAWAAGRTEPEPVAALLDEAERTMKDSYAFQLGLRRRMHAAEAAQAAEIAYRGAAGAAMTDPAQLETIAGADRADISLARAMERVEVAVAELARARSAEDARRAARRRHLWARVAGASVIALGALAALAAWTGGLKRRGA